MPGEGLTHGPPATKKAGGSHHRISQIIRHSLRDGFTAYTRSPQGPAFLPLSSALVKAPRTWPQHREARTTRFRRPHCLPFVSRSNAAIASPPHVSWRSAETSLLPRRD